MKIIAILLFMSSAFSAEIHTHGNDHIDGLHQVEQIEENCTARGAFCCRMSGYIIDFSGSATGYLSAALAGASSISSIDEDTRTKLAISAGITALISGLLHNIKTIVHKIAKEKQDRAEELHRNHTTV